MSTTIEKERDSWKTNAIVLALLAGLFGALVTVADTNVVSNHISSENFWVSTCVYLIYGGWVGFFTNLFIYNRAIGKRIDPSFVREQWVGWKYQKYALGAGALAAFKTGAYLYILAEDARTVVVIALSNLALVWLAIFDKKHKIPIRILFTAVLLVIVGGGLIGIEELNSDTFKFASWAVLVMVVFHSIPEAQSKIWAGKVVNELGKANLNFWRFFWLALSGTIIAVSVAVGMGIVGEVVALFSEVWLKALPWVLLTMFFAFGGNFFEIAGYGHESVTGVSLLASSKGVLAIPITLFATMFFPPDTFKISSLAPEVAIIKFVGALAVAVGVCIVVWEIEKKKKREKEKLVS